MEAFAFAVHSFEIVLGWNCKKEAVWNMMIMGMKVGRIVIVSLRLVFIQVIGYSCLVESNSIVVEKGGCVIEEAGNEGRIHDMP